MASRFVDKSVFQNLYSLFRIYRGALWILGEYCSTKEDIQSVMTEVRRSLGEVCFYFHCNCYFIIFFLRFCLLLERGREGGEGEKHQCVVASLTPLTGPQPRCMPQTGNETSDPLVLSPGLNPLSHTSQSVTATLDGDFYFSTFAFFFLFLHLTSTC